MVMVTERVTASLANVLSGFEGLPPEAQRSAAELQMSDLERKHGLLQARLPARARAFNIAAAERWSRAPGGGGTARLRGAPGRTTWEQNTGCTRA